MIESNKPSFRYVDGLVRFSWLILLFFGLATAYLAPRGVKLIGSISTDLAKLLPDTNFSVSKAKEVRDNFSKKGNKNLILIIDAPTDPEATKNLKVFIEDFADYLRSIPVMIDQVPKWVQVIIPKYSGKFPDVGILDYKKDSYDFFRVHKLMYVDLKDLETIRDRVQKKIQQEKLGPLYIDFEEEGKPKSKDKEGFDFHDLTYKYRAEYGVGSPSAYRTNDDETIYALSIYPKSTNNSLGFYKTFYKYMSDQISRFDTSKYGKVNIAYTGPIKGRIDEFTTINNDLKVAGAISLLGILLVLLIYFRRPSGVALIFIPLGCGILLGFGVCSFFLKELNLVTAFLFSILTGLGVEIGIHMLARFVQERKAGASLKHALDEMIFKSGRSATVGAITNCGVFFILIINDFRGFSQFGWIAGIGVLITLISYLLLFPVLIYYADKLHLINYSKNPEKTNPNRLKKFPFALPVVMVSCLIFLGAVFLLPKLQFEWNYAVLKIKVPETQIARDKQTKISGRVNSAAAMIVHSKEEADALKQEFEKRRLEDTHVPTIQGFKSFYDLVPDRQDEKLKVIREIGVLLEDDALNVLKGDDKIALNEFREAVALSQPVKAEDLLPSIKEPFLPLDPNSSARLAFITPLPDLELDDGRNAIQFYKDIHEVDLNGKKFYSVSDSIIFADVLQTMFKDSRKVMALSFLMFFVMIYLDFKNLKKTFVVYGSVFWGVIVMGCIMVFTGLKFNFYNMVIIPLVLGNTVDNSIHLVHRFYELKGESVMEALRTSGSAALVSSLTNILGYSGLMFAHHPGLSSIGVLAILGMSCCIVGTLVFLPAFLQVALSKKKVD